MLRKNTIITISITIIVIVAIIVMIRIVGLVGEIVGISRRGVSGWIITIAIDPSAIIATH
jgi:uncharacterized oligopeptide transporter (OPT) family protein